MKPKILVTGSSGFVGGAFISQIQKEFDIYAVGRQISSGVTPSHFFQIDLSESDAKMKLSEYLDDYHFHSAIHFAAATPHAGLTDQTEFYEVNTIGTYRFLQAIRENVDKFAYISTVDIYGMVERPVIDEASIPNPTNIYGISKYAAEIETLIWSKETHIPSAIFRLGQIYGPGDPSKKAIPNFCRAVLENKPIIIQGSGQDIRQPIYIQDVVSAIKTWVISQPNKKQAQYLLVGSEQITIQSLAEMISQIDPLKRIEIINKPAIKPLTHQYFNNDQTRKILKWKPIVPLIEGLEKTLKSMQN
jgi:nucleoside-diphosphate-sugar epimerase